MSPSATNSTVHAAPARPTPHLGKAVRRAVASELIKLPMKMTDLPTQATTRRSSRGSAEPTG